MARVKATVALFVGLTLAGCGAEEAEVEPAGMEPAGGMQGMEGMPGMGEMPMNGGMMDQMQAHMQTMEGADGQRYQAMMPMHRQMVANMIAQFNREMRDMNMATDAEWDETVEMLRQDLREMPEMSPEELETLMPEHRQRVMRLMETHREMMGSMRM